MPIARALEVLVGLIFVFGAALKAANIPGFAAGIRSYHVFYNPDLLYNLAVVTVVVETILGAALLAGVRMRGAVHAAAIALLVFFTGLIAYAWAVHGIEDCGCFGDYIKMGPGASIIKNLVMMAMILIPWIVSRRHEHATRWPFEHASARVATVAVSVALVACIAAFNAQRGAVEAPTVASNAGPALAATTTGPFSGIRVADDAGHYDLGDGTYLVAILSATCEHCKSSIEPLNLLLAEPTTPKVVGLMMGEPRDIEDFRMETMPLFPTQRVDTMLWLKLLGDAPAPPRFVLVTDGAAIEHWDDEVPPADAIAGSAAPMTREREGLS